MASDAESSIQRKPGANNFSRKPFLDKAVNCKTPDVTIKKLSSNIPKESVKQASPKELSPSLEFQPEDVFSYKQVRHSDANFWF